MPADIVGETKELKAQSGFTLLELLLVVVILTTLVAIVATSFGDAATGSQKSATSQNVKIVQSSIERYRADHGHYPGPTDWIRGGCPGYNPKFNVGSDFGLFLRNRLALYTNELGTVCDSAEDDEGGHYHYGPYLLNSVPINPNSGSRKVYISGIDPSAETNLNGFGWSYNYNSGLFSAAPE